MNKRELFVLAVRLLGLVFLYHGLRDFPVAVGQILSAFPHYVAPHVKQGFNFTNLLAGVFNIVWPLTVACWLLRGAALVVDFAYADEQNGVAQTRHTGA